MSLFNEYEFKRCIDRHNGDRHAVKFNCRDQFLVMSFARFTDRACLRDIETTLNLCGDLYRSGVKAMPRSTLAEANEKKDRRIYQDFATSLVKGTTTLYKNEKLRIGLEEMIYALMDLRGSIPTFALLMPDKVNDARGIDKIPVESGAFYLTDKGYVAFEKLYTYFQQKGAYFVTRAKDNMPYEVIESSPADKCSGVLSDETIRLTGYYSTRKYPDTL